MTAPADPAPDLRPGQRWAYPARPGEDKSRAVILKVEDLPPAGRVAHVAVEGVRIPGVPAAADGTTRIAHMPYDADALVGCLTAHAGDGPVPDFADGYAEWRAAFDRGEAGVWTAPIAVAVDGMAAAVAGGGAG